MAQADGPLYERLGATYTATRSEDPRVAAQVRAALGDARRIVNVGAGTGSYEPRDRAVVAVEPSPTMIRQRPAAAAPVVQATAEALPLPTASFDAAMAVLTVHHWGDVPAGLAELRRVAERQVVLFFEPLLVHEFWLLDWFPQMAELPTEVRSPGAAELAEVLDVIDVQPVLVPRDCVDGFAAAYWARPEAYLDPIVQAGISTFQLLDPELRAAGTRRLADDLESGAWDERYGHLRSLDAFDGGYRLAIARS